jgi:hypothetical protein
MMAEDPLAFLKNFSFGFIIITLSKLILLHQILKVNRLRKIGSFLCDPKPINDGNGLLKSKGGIIYCVEWQAHLQKIVRNGYYASKCAKIVGKACLHRSMATRNGLNNGFYQKRTIGVMHCLVLKTGSVFLNR